MTTKGLLGNFMAFIFCVQVACKEDDRPQADVVSQRAAVSTPNPLQHCRATDACVRFSGRKRNKVTENLFSVPELEADSATSGQVLIDSCA
jgi:hypothetical protein